MSGVSRTHQTHTDRHTHHAGIWRDLGALLSFCIAIIRLNLRLGHFAMQIGARCDAVKLICHLSTLTAREPHVIASGKGDVAATATATATANVAVAEADELRAATAAVDRRWQVEQIGLNMLLATLLPVDSWTATSGDCGGHLRGQTVDCLWPHNYFLFPQCLAVRCS